METHIVRSGETLTSIAHGHATTWQAIADLNHITQPNDLVVGKRLRLPDRHVNHPHPGAKKPTAHPQLNPNIPAMPAPPGNPVELAGGVTFPELKAIMPTAGANVAIFIGPLNVAMKANGIDTSERRAAFLAQISVESGDLHNTRENLNYSAERLHKVWHKRFPTIASAQPYAHNPEALGNHVYANRLGNGDEASGDGYRYRGRGLMQVTGRDNYRAAGLETTPDDLADPSKAANSAAWFWSTNGLNLRSKTLLSRGAFDGITQIVNGGQNGSDARWAAYKRAADILGLPQPR